MQAIRPQHPRLSNELSNEHSSEHSRAQHAEHSAKERGIIRNAAFGASDRLPGNPAFFTSDLPEHRPKPSGLVTALGSACGSLSLFTFAALLAGSGCQGELPSQRTGVMNEAVAGAQLQIERVPASGRVLIADAEGYLRREDCQTDDCPTYANPTLCARLDIHTQPVLDGALCGTCTPGPQSQTTEVRTLCGETQLPIRCDDSGNLQTCHLRYRGIASGDDDQTTQAIPRQTRLDCRNPADSGSPGNPGGGTPGTGNPGSGTPATGTPATGTPATGTPATGTPGSGTPGSGTPGSGTPGAPSLGGTLTHYGAFSAGLRSYEGQLNGLLDYARSMGMRSSVTMNMQGLRETEIEYANEEMERALRDVEDGDYDDAFCARNNPGSNDGTSPGVPPSVTGSIAHDIHNQGYTFREGATLACNSIMNAARSLAMHDLLCDGNRRVDDGCSPAEVAAAIAGIETANEIADDRVVDRREEPMRSEGMACSSPLVIDLDGDGIEATSGSAAFDLLGNGHVHHWAWIGGGDALLARDLNGNGRIDDGRELFGEGTRIPVDSHRGGSRKANRQSKTSPHASHHMAIDGFDALRPLDENGDGVVDASDSAFSTLLLWTDNGDGISQPHELRSITDTDLTSLHLRSKESGHHDKAGSWHRYWSHVERRDGTRSDMVDIYFRRVQGK